MVGEAGGKLELGVWVGRTDQGLRSCGADVGKPAWGGPGAQPPGAWGAGAHSVGRGAGAPTMDAGVHRRDSGAGAPRIDSGAGAQRTDTGAHRTEAGAVTHKTGPVITGSGAEPRDVSKQHCDTQANRLGAGEGAVEPLPTDNLQSAAVKRGGGTPLSRDGMRQSVSGDRSPGKGGDKTDSTHQLSAASGDEKTEDEAKKKPRRRRHRRRRRKAKSVEGEGLSDGMSGMERTVSSSNISRTSDVTLHFEDDLEFPEIGASSGNEGLCAVSMPQVMSTPPAAVDGAFMRVESPSPLSYSDILRRVSWSTVFCLFHICIIYLFIYTYVWLSVLCYPYN